MPIEGRVRIGGEGVAARDAALRQRMNRGFETVARGLVVVLVNAIYAATGTRVRKLPIRL